jgi:hypothetical protein
VAMLALLATGCGGGDDNGSDSSSGSGSGSDTEATTSGDLKAKLLTVGDLGTGYTVDDSGTTEDENDPGEFCKDLATLEDKYKSKEEAEVDFNKGQISMEGGAFLMESLERYSSAAEANKVFDEGSAAFKKCKTFELKEDDGSTFKGSFAEASFTKVGDETFAARLTGTAGAGGISLPLAGDFVVVRRADVIMLVAALGFGSKKVDAAELETIVKKAEAKV